ncbi:MAG TPA: DUF4349 domain-containing protein [Candidatus Limnocylindrales bacterium]|nr:DUF4349 domain-containing protein [Candidatus Limnocylindrales bacterium]
MARSKVRLSGRFGRLIVLLAVVVVAACAGGAQLNTIGSAVDHPAAAPAADGEANPQSGTVFGPSTDGTSRSVPGTTATYDVSRPDLLIIKTGTLSLQVAGIDDALAAASTKIAALGGYVSGSDRSGDGDQQVATETYRIPAAQWDAALVALRGLAGKVLAEQTQTQDVTGDVLDLGARITNLQATESALQAIMAKATKITDVLAVQQQLTDVRGQIEQLSTEKKHLEGQAAFSTLTVSYSLKAQAAVVMSQKQFDPNSEVDKASASLIEVLQALATAGIWFAIVWLPILLALGVLAGVAFLIVRRVRRNRIGPGSILPTPTAPAAEA